MLKMNFTEQLKMTETMYTENGALVYKTSGNIFTDFLFNIMKYRDEYIPKNELNQLYDNNPILTTALTLFVRDRINGMGERKIGRELSKFLINKFNVEGKEKSMTKLFGTLITLGRWDDLLYQDLIPYDLISMQLEKDLNDENPSLLAKWLPSINAGYASRKKALELCKHLNLPKSVYRKMLSKIRKKLNLVETKLVNKAYSSIEYDKVPSQAMRKYRNAFARNDSDNFSNYLEEVKNGTKKINTSTSNPVEVIQSYIATDMHMVVKKYDPVLEEIWKNLPVKEVSNTLVIRDGSGSMSGTPMNVGDALTLYTSEHSKTEAFKNKFIEFSSKSNVVDLSGCKSLHDKLHLLRTKYTDCSNTNLEAVFDHVLETALRFKLKQEEIPNLLIVSDMQFDCAVGDNYYVYDQEEREKLFSIIKNKYEEKGYKLPKLIFWNVNSPSSNGCIPVQENELGVILVSGYSQNILDMVMSEELDSFKALIDILTKKGYISIAKEILS